MLIRRSPGTPAVAARARHRLLRSAAAVLATFLLLPVATSAQGCLNLGGNTPEAKLMAFYAAPLTFSTVMQPQQLKPWQWQVALEITPMQNADSARRATQCYTASKGEATNLASVFPRPRLALGLPWNLVAELSYVPPIRVKDATANLAGVSLAWTQRVVVFAGSSVFMQVRGHTVIGYVEGPITCGREALQADPSKPCFGTKESNDRFTPNVSGVDVAVALDVSDYAMFAGVGLNAVNSEFHVDFTNGTGFRDRNKVTLRSPLNRYAFMAGGTWRAHPRLDITAQIYSQTDNISMLRLVGAWRFSREQADP